MAVKALSSVTITGNVGGDPTVQTFTDQRTGRESIVTEFSVATYGGKLDRTQPYSQDNSFSKWYTVRFRGTLGDTRTLAEDVSETIKKGDRVVVSGRLGYFVGKDKDGNVLDHKEGKNIRDYIEASDIVVCQKDPSQGGGTTQRELPPI